MARDRKTHTFNSVSNKNAMAAVLAWLADQAEGSSNVTADARRIEAGRHAAGDAKAYELEIARLTAKRSRLANLYTDGDIDRTDYLTQKAEIDASLTVAKEGHLAAQAREAASGVDTIVQFTTLIEEWHRFEPAEHREALAAVLRYITVMPGPYGPGKIVPLPAWETGEPVELPPVDTRSREHVQSPARTDPSTQPS